MRVRTALLRPLLTLSAVLLALPHAVAQTPEPPLSYSRQPNFRIPFQIDPGERRIVQVQLHVSEDQGRTWSQFASVAPAEQRTFSFQALHDGLFWFTVRTMDREGRGYPATLEGSQPQLKVIVDTQPPVVTLRALAAQNGLVGVEWQIADDNLDLNTLTLEYHPASGGDWLPLGAERLAAGRKTWNPSTNAPLQVRLRVHDKAGNPGEGTVQVAMNTTTVGGGGGVPDTGAARSPYPVAGGNVYIVNSTRISLNYEIKDVGPSKISVVELHYTQDGRSWQKYPKVDTTGQPPYVMEVSGEGLYGFTLIAHSGVGQGDPPPRVGDAPQIWVEVDLTKPVVQLRNVEVGRGTDAGNLTISWSATDKNLGSQPIALSYAERPEGPWTPIQTNLENTGRYIWRMPPGVPFRFLLKIEATDKAGNVGSAQSDPSHPVIVDLSQPKVQVLGVEPASRP